MMKNTITDLNNYLFEQLERLNDDLNDDQFNREVKRSKAVADISRNVIENAKLALEVMKYKSDYDRTPPKMPKMLETKDEKKRVTFLKTKGSVSPRLRRSQKKEGYRLVLRRKTKMVISRSRWPSLLNTFISQN